MSTQHEAPFMTACTASSCLERRVVDGMVEFRSSDPSSDGAIATVPMSTWKRFIAEADNGLITRTLLAFQKCDIDAFLTIRVQGSGVILIDIQQGAVVLTGEEWGTFLDNPLDWSLDDRQTPRTAATTR